MKSNFHPLSGMLAAAILTAASEPVTARFISPDTVPVKQSTGENFNRYWYASNNPFAFTDPDGRYSERFWSSPTAVTIRIPYTIVDPSGVATFTPAQVNADISNKMSGTVQINGNAVTVTAIGVNVAPNSQAVQDGKANVVTVDPNVTRSSTNQIGGDQVSLRGTAGAPVVTHELGHTAGAGDQYPGGVDASGARIPSTAQGTTNNVMGDTRGPANAQTLQEIVTSPTAAICTSNGTCP